jgi:FkbM family methyltransferase
MSHIGKEARRVKTQFGNLLRYGSFNPFPRTRRKQKPTILRAHPEWEICSALEFVASHVNRGKDEFFFIQIGAYDGAFDDPVSALVRKHGWRGVLVEPQPAAFAQLKRNYSDQPQLIFENAAIGDKDGEVTLYTLNNGTSPLASFQRRHLVRHAQKSGDIVERQVASLTFQSLLAKHGLSDVRVDLVQIDAEGCDARIIDAIDLEAVRPAIIRYEHVNLTRRERCACIEHLACYGYRILLEDTDTLAYQERTNVAASSRCRISTSFTTAQ